MFWERVRGEGWARNVVSGLGEFKVATGIPGRDRVSVPMSRQELPMS